MDPEGVIALSCDPGWMLKAAGFDPDPWQLSLLRSRSDRILICCSRQVGKSTSTSLVALWTAMVVPDSLVLLLSPSMRQSTELFKKVTENYAKLGRFVPAAKSNMTTLELVNGSRIISLPESEGTIRGYSGVALLVIDEASRVDDALYGAVLPMLATSRGRLIALTTPFGMRGWFHKEWTKGKGWERIAVKAADCPRIPAEFLEEQKLLLGPSWYSQEYEVTFVDDIEAVFSAAVIGRAFDPAVKPLWHDGGTYPELDSAVSPLFVGGFKP